MNWSTAAYLRAASCYYQRRQPADLSALRPLWARALALAKAEDVGSALTDAEAAMVDAPPGGAELLQHAGGLHITIEGELLSTFPTAEYVEAIRQSTGTITIRLNCPGGDLLGAFALHDSLLPVAHRVEVLVAGCAGSAATLILCAGDRRRIVEGSRIWTHAPVLCVLGNSLELRHAANELDGLKPRMARVYERVCPAELVSSWLCSGDHFFTAPEALAVGLGTEVVPAIVP